MAPWLVELLRGGYPLRCLPLLSAKPSLCLPTAPRPSGWLCLRRSPSIFLPRVRWSLLHLPLSVFSCRLFVVWSARGRGVRSSVSWPSFASWVCHASSWSPFGLSSFPSVWATDWPPSIFGKLTGRFRSIRFPVPASAMWPYVSVPGVGFRPIHGPASFPSGLGSCFCLPALAGCPHA